MPPKTYSHLRSEIAGLREQLKLSRREVERLKEELNNMNAGHPAHALGYDCNVEISVLRAEVERLRWMLREVYGDWVDGESYESWLADLARRWEKHDAT